MNLMKFFKKKVKIIDIDGKEWSGFVDCFDNAGDNEMKCDSISVDTEKGFIEFGENEINSIEVIENE